MSLQLIARPGLAKTSLLPETSSGASPALRSAALQQLLLTPKLPSPETVVVAEPRAAAWVATPAWGAAAASRHRWVETVLMVAVFGYFGAGSLMTLLR